MYLIKLLHPEYQFVNPSPKGSELINSASGNRRTGVFRENQ